MKKVIFATQNEGKIKEVREIMPHIHVMTMNEAGINIDIVEDGETFEANAIKKAEEIMKLSGQIVLADDSGLEIDYFDRGPGIHSARFLGKDTPYIQKNAIILDRMKQVPMEKRTARFVCAIAAAFPNRDTIVTKGIMEGYIGCQSKGNGGFGYDPIFFPEGTSTSTAEISPALKNKISHRGKALEAMKIQLEEILENVK